MRHASAKSISQSAAFLFLLVSLLIPTISFAQENDSSDTGLLRKQQALSRLGNRLPAVAARYGKTPSELRRMFLQDSTLHVDKNDNLLYVEKAPDAAELAEMEAASAPNAAQAAPYPYAQTFSLHSRPSATRKIYLDFNGHTISDQNAWRQNGAGTTAAPFDLDANPGNFSTAEQDVIQNVWLRMAEDYAPFDVDVTTDISLDGLSEINGSRAVFTPTNFMGAGIGGVAYIGAFGWGEMYQPAWIFSAGFGNSDKGLAEAASHEVGHNVGLQHDGTTTVGYYAGHGVWAPIMGVGYNRSVSQWSKGEYLGANNQEDDLAIIQKFIPLIADDYGNTTATASVLNGTTLNAAGLITTSADVDVFRFTTGTGSVSININSAPRGANLDIKAQLLDSAGNVIATSDPSSVAYASTFPEGMSAGFNQTLSAGTYYLKIDGVGNPEGDGGGYSDYASIGQYFITGTLASGGGTAQAPIAVASANPLSGAAPLTVNFSSAGSSDADGSIVGYFWNFGDGTTSTAPNPSKIYSLAGTYTATLTVTDNSGLTGSAGVSINVSNPLVSSIAGTVSYGVTPVGQSTKNVSGVLVSATGWSNVSTTTAANGAYLLGNLINGGSYNVSLSKTGGANGITTFDATLVMRHVASGGIGANALTANQQFAADANGDGAISSFDATLILRYVAAGGATAATAFTGNWKFSPAPRTYGSVSSALTNQNYEAFLTGEVSGDWSSTAPGIISPGKSEYDVRAVKWQSETEAQVSLPANAAAQSGSDVLIPITISNADASIEGFMIEVAFDPNVLQPLSNPVFTEGTLSDSSNRGKCMVVSNTPDAGNAGKLRIAAACAGGLTNSGTLFNLGFNVVGTANTPTGTSALEFTFKNAGNGFAPVSIFENNNGALSVGTINGSFIVANSASNDSVAVGGRVLTAEGRGLRNAQVRLTTSDGATRTVMSAASGYFRFTDVRAGQTVKIEVVSKRYGFQPQTVKVSEGVSDVNFIAQ